MIRSLVISQQQMGTREVVVLPYHWNQTLTNPEFACHLENARAWMLRARFSALHRCGKVYGEDMELLRKSPLIPDDVKISGGVYDVDTGRIHEVL